MTTAARDTTQLNGIQVLRAFAAVLVLLFHAASKEQEVTYGAKHHFLGAFSSFGYAGVDLFFVISGFVITWAHFDDLGHPEKLGRYLTARAIRIFPIFWITWLITAVLLINVFGSQLPQMPDILPRTIKALLLIDPKAHTFIPQAWTLNYEMMFYALFSLMILAPRQAIYVFSALWILCIVAGAFGVIPVILPLEPICAYFLLGIGIATAAKFNRCIFPLCAITAGFAWAVIGITLNEVGYLHAPQIPFHRVLIFGPAAALLVYGVVGLDLRKPSTYPPALIFLGNASYALYLVHVTVLWMLVAAGDAVRTMPQYIALLVAMIFLPIVAAGLLHVGIEKPVMAALHRPKATALKLAGIASIFAVSSVGIAAAMDKIVPLVAPRHTYSAQLENNILTLNGTQIPLRAERQGWAATSADRRDITGWAKDREREQTAIDLLVFADGRLHAVIPPMVPDTSEIGANVKSVDQRRVGFSFPLPELSSLGCTRIIALFSDSQAGELYYKVADADAPPAPASCVIR
jgi:exopolysaccharide production protein ExoZ